MGLIRNYAQYHADQRSQLGGRSDNHYHVLLPSIISVCECDVVHPSGDCFTPAELIRYADYVGERKRRNPLPQRDHTRTEPSPLPVIRCTTGCCSWSWNASAVCAVHRSIVVFVCSLFRGSLGIRSALSADCCLPRHADKVRWAAVFSVDWNELPKRICAETDRVQFRSLHCVQKKHPLTFSSISPWLVCRFKQKLQWIYLRNGRFWSCRN